MSGKHTKPIEPRYLPPQDTTRAAGIPNAAEPLSGWQAHLPSSFLGLNQLGDKIGAGIGESSSPNLILSIADR
jgi:hypothetical protein